MEMKRNSTERSEITGIPLTLTTTNSSSNSRENSVRRTSRGHPEEGMQVSINKKTNITGEDTSSTGGASIKSETSGQMLTKRDSQRELSMKSGHHQQQIDEQGSPKSQKKFISTWRMACDKTKDRTKELLKRWRTMPEGGAAGGGGGNLEEETESDASQKPTDETQEDNHGWSVHVWATWVKRYPNDEDSTDTEDKPVINLTVTQKEKLGHLFSHIFDMDRDDIISMQDFESFSERLRHFADWSSNCGESVILEQVQQGFIETFILPLKPDNSSEETTPAVVLDRLFLSLEDWLSLWGDLLQGVKSFQNLPVWLQYFPKVIFHAINKSGSGIMTRDELSAFYSSVMGFSAQRVGEIIDEAYKAMTANGDMKLTYAVYRLCFANFLIGRFPNGPGQYLFGYAIKHAATFPIDYSAMNTSAEDQEPYTPDNKTNRTSIIV